MTESLQELLGQLSPLLTAGGVWIVTQGTKRFMPVFRKMLSKGWFRFAILILAYLGTMATAALTGNDINPLAIGTLVEGSVAWFVANAFHFLKKKKPVS